MGTIKDISQRASDAGRRASRTEAFLKELYEMGEAVSASHRTNGAKPYQAR